jgi:hypothetical protein
MRILPFIIVLLLFTIGCKKEEFTPGYDPNFTIVENSDKDFKDCNKKVVVFDIPIYAVSGVSNNKLPHGANIMAQYLDNK